ncbi:MAG: sulfatase, partial [Bacteroidales bacterium]
MKRLATATLAFLPTLLACNHQENHPNVVFILTDQWRSSGFGFAGDSNVKTPNLDKFASEAARFNNAVSVCPVCTPYRGSLLTGRYPTSTGMFLNDACLPEEELCLAEVYKQNGYQTAYIGKWHLDGHGRLDYTPPERRQGFDYWKALECSHDYNRMPYYEGDLPEMKFWDDYSPYAVCEDAGRYVSSHAKDKSPFFLFVSIAAPHFPHQTAPDDLKELYPPDDIKVNPNVPEELRAKVQKELQGYYAHCTAIDRAIGRLLDQLKSLGLWDRTLIVFTSDHGEMMGAHGIPATQKQVPWIESGGVPLLIHFPAAKRSKRQLFEMPVTTPDLSATLLNLSGIDLPGSFEGVSFARNLKSGRDDPGRGALYMSVAPFAAVPKEAKREYRALKTARYTYVKGLDGPW